MQKTNPAVLIAAMQALEQQRDTLGPAVLEAALAPLREIGRASCRERVYACV